MKGWSGRFLLASLLLAGCAGRTAEPSTPVAPAAPALASIAGLDWTLAAATGIELPASARRPTLRFEADGGGGFAGCNRYRGAISTDGPGRIAFVPGTLVSTMMACQGPQSTIEAAYLRALAAVSSYALADGGLVLRWRDGDRGGELVFRRP